MARGVGDEFVEVKRRAVFGEIVVVKGGDAGLGQPVEFGAERVAEGLGFGLRLDDETQQRSGLPPFFLGIGSYVEL